MPIIELYRSRDKLRVIDSKGTPEEVYEKAKEYFRQLTY
jgi:adenylate kinase family enzyme